MIFTHWRHRSFQLLQVAGICITLWWSIWGIAILQYEHVITAMLNAVRDQGYQVSYEDRRSFGFPHRVALRFTNVKWKNNNGIEFLAPDLDITSAPWIWWKFDAHFKHGAVIDVPLEIPGQALHLSGKEGRAHVELDANDEWRTGHIVLTDAQIGRTPEYLYAAHNLEATATRPLNPPKDHNETGLTITGECEDITLPVAMPAPFGPKISKLTLGLRVMGAMPDVRVRSSVDAWNKESGVVEFDHLAMNWGPMGLSAKGTMGFDDDLQPEGAFASHIDGEGAVLKALIAGGFIATDQADILNEAVAHYGEQASEASPSTRAPLQGVDVPITIELGTLFLGPVRIFTFPPIIWQVGSLPARPASGPP